MRYSVHGVYEQLRETVCSYLDTAYKIAHPKVFQERQFLLRQEGVISQLPFVETTPRFKTTIKLADLELPFLPSKLAELSVLGLLDKRFPLYTHQEKALRASWHSDGTPGNLLVATGTGSGKTETFYLPVLAEILRDATRWVAPKPNVNPKPGYWNGLKWVDNRSHEQRPKALRAIILYPMNALVNDQLRRLRRTLASPEAIQWQLNNLNGNLIYFGRYTGQTKLAGIPTDKTSTKWKTYISETLTKWQNFDEESKKLGDWPNPEGPNTPEMLCRWDMQAAPPDILITNYSMLEYMLVRPIEASIFEATKQWLNESKEHIFTLVLDEAHTYSGARGTEVAYLIRRLYERLGVRPEQIRCIGTSASLGEDQISLGKALHFVGELFGQKKETFTLIRAENAEYKGSEITPKQSDFDALVSFQNNSSLNDKILEELIEALSPSPKSSTTLNGKLYETLKEHSQVSKLEFLTARNAMPLQEVADKLWPEMGTNQERLDATAALLAIGANARPENLKTDDVPPLGV